MTHPIEHGSQQYDSSRYAIDPDATPNLQTQGDEVDLMRRLSDTAAGNPLQIDFASFTADDLVAWAASQLSSIDQQMHDLVGQVQNNSNRSSVFSQVASIVNQFQTEHPASDTDDHADLDMTLTSHTFHLADGTTQTMNLENALHYCGYGSVMAADGTAQGIAGAYSNTNIGDFAHALQSFGQTINDDSEQISMRLQSLSSRRSQVTQMASQLIASLNDTASKVVGNIR